jgi:hypothetical protein
MENGFGLDCFVLKFGLVFIGFLGKLLDGILSPGSPFHKDSLKGIYYIVHIQETYFLLSNLKQFSRCFKSEPSDLNCAVEVSLTDFITELI